MQLNKEVGKSNNNICLILSGADVAKVGISEARYMSECIQKRLRPINRSQVKIFLDENSTNTLGNALNCCKIISDQIMHTQSTDHIHHIALVTNEFHMPRAHLLFKSALRNSKVRIHAISAENGLAPGNEYRSLSNRPLDANEWTVRERLDWEWNGLCSLQSLLQPNHVDDENCNNGDRNSVEGNASSRSSSISGSISDDDGGGGGNSSMGRLLTMQLEDLDAAKEQIRKLNETLFYHS